MQNAPDPIAELTERSRRLLRELRDLEVRLAELSRAIANVSETANSATKPTPLPAPDQERLKR